jgi:dimeric dUTPase (all-alpha-NTP-PPase superfamily)
MMNMREFMSMQNKLQEGMKQANPDVDTDSPFNMSREELARFITWNHSALIVELGEMMQEVGWKPWASSRHVNHPQAMQEMVDAWHFFLNILLALAAMNYMSIWEMAIQFENYYQEKNAKNLQRQVDGYDGVSDKCPKCQRDTVEATTRMSQPLGDERTIYTYCQCGYVLKKEKA